MTSINKTILLGHVGSIPEVRQMPSGDKVMNISVATTSRYLDKKTDEWKELTEWHKVVLFGKQVTGLEVMINKGSEIFVEGMLRTRKWKDANGNDKQTTEVKADICKVFAKEASPASAQPKTTPEPPDDLPF
jgi:single-strand DNA-binding protein